LQASKLLMVPSSITAAATSLATSHEVKPGRNHTWFDITTTFGRFANYKLAFSYRFHYV